MSPSPQRSDHPRAPAQPPPDRAHADAPQHHLRAARHHQRLRARATNPEELLGSSALELNLSDDGPVVQRTTRFCAPHPHPRVPTGLQVKFLVTHIIWADPSQSVMLETQMLFGNCFEHAVALPFADREQFLVMVEDYVDMRAAGAVDLHPDCV